MGEILPWWADRFDHRLCIYKNELTQINKNVLKHDKLKEFKLPKLTLREYLKQNIYVTTSGWFSDSALKYVIDIMGVDRVLFSIDYPYENQKIASDWIDNVDLPLEQKEKIAYKNAAKLLKIKM
jgi:2,3-dihydroxybenzoate decarboxylase